MRDRNLRSLKLLILLTPLVALGANADERPQISGEATIAAEPPIEGEKESVAGSESLAVAATPTPAPAATPTPAPAATPTPAPAATPTPAPAATPTSAPATTPTPTPATTGQGAEGASTAPKPSPAATPQEPPRDPNAIYLTAEEQGREEGHIWARGFTDLQAGEMHVQTDLLDIYDVARNDGSVGQKLIAEGNVVLLRGKERLSGARMTMDLDTGRGVIENAVGYLEPGVFLRARKLERLDPKTFRITRGSFTSCCQPNPRWSFWSPWASMKLGKRITAVSPTFFVGTPLPWIKKLPAFWLPAFVYPIQEDGRATGLLIPDFNIDFQRGVDVRFGFFLAMHRSWDQTFSAEYRPKLAPRLGHELRYILDPPSQGRFMSYFFPPQKGGGEPLEGLPAPNEDWEYDLDWYAVQIFPGGFRTKLLVNQSSPQNIQADVSRILDTQRRASVVLQRQFGAHGFMVKADSRETFVGDRSNAKRYLPDISLSMPQRRLGRSEFLFNYVVQAANIVRKRTNGQTSTWWRVDAAPALTRTFGYSFLRVTPRIEARQTWYEKSLAVDPDSGDPIPNDLTGGALMRRYLQADLEILGPQFSKVYVNQSGIFSERFKHVIGPEATWTYRAATENSTRIQSFDGVDSMVKEHSLNIGLVQRVYAKRKTLQNKLVPFELFSWRVYQTYYVEIPKTASDPNFTSPITGPGNTPTHWSHVRSEVRLSPIENWALNYTHEYDVNFHGTTSMTVNAVIRSTVFDARGMWMTSSRPDGEMQKLVRASENIVANVGLRPIGNAIYLSASASYDRLAKRFLERGTSAYFKVQCFGLRLDFTQREIYGDKPDRRFGFSIELENLGSIGMDPEMLGGRR